MSNLLVGEVLRQRIEQFVVARRVRVAEVVDRIDDALAHQVEPDAVGDRLREERVLGRGQPVGEHAAAVLAGLHLGVADAHVARLHRLAGARLSDLARACEEDHLRGVGRRGRGLRADDRLGLGLHLREPRGHAVVVVLAPALEGMVVALRALHPHAEEELGGGFGQALRVLGDAVVVRGRVGEGVAVGGDDRLHHLVPRRVLLELLPEPRLEAVAPLRSGSSCGWSAARPPT